MTTQKKVDPRMHVLMTLVKMAKDSRKENKELSDRCINKMFELFQDITGEEFQENEKLAIYRELKKGL